VISFCVDVPSVSEFLQDSLHILRRINGQKDFTGVINR